MIKHVFPFCLHLHNDQFFLSGTGLCRLKSCISETGYNAHFCPCNVNVVPLAVLPQQTDLVSIQTFYSVSVITESYERKRIERRTGPYPKTHTQLGRHSRRRLLCCESSYKVYIIPKHLIVDW